MNLKTLLFAVGAVVGILLVMNTVYTIHETERAIVLRFGEFAKSDIPPGVHWKFPFADEVRKFDGRILTVDVAEERYLTVQQDPLRVDSFAKWRIADVARFYVRNAGDEERASSRLRERVSEGLRNEISSRTQHEVISGERDQLMVDLTARLNEVMTEEMGVEVVDVRVKQIDLPTEVEEAVYQRMNSDREIKANEERANGQELAIGRRASADREVTVIEAEGYRDAEEIRGDGDAQAASIYADAFNQDPEFYAFYRRVIAYPKVFKSRDDLLVLDPESDFFKYLHTSEKQ